MYRDSLSCEDLIFSNVMNQTIDKFFPRPSGLNMNVEENITNHSF